MSSKTAFLRFVAAVLLLCAILYCIGMSATNSIQQTNKPMWSEWNFIDIADDNLPTAADCTAQQLQYVAAPVDDWCGGATLPLLFWQHAADYSSSIDAATTMIFNKEHCVVAAATDADGDAAAAAAATTIINNDDDCDNDDGHTSTVVAAAADLPTLPPPAAAAAAATAVLLPSRRCASLRRSCTLYHPATGRLRLRLLQQLTATPSRNKRREVACRRLRKAGRFV